MFSWKTIEICFAKVHTQKYVWLFMGKDQIDLKKWQLAPIVRLGTKTWSPWNMMMRSRCTGMIGNWASPALYHSVLRSWTGNIFPSKVEIHHFLHWKFGNVFSFKVCKRPISTHVWQSQTWFPWMWFLSIHNQNVKRHSTRRCSNSNRHQTACINCVMENQYAIAIDVQNLTALGRNIRYSGYQESIWSSWKCCTIRCSTRPGPTCKIPHDGVSGRRDGCWIRS